GEPRPQLLKKAQRCYDEIAARFDINVVNTLDALVAWVFARIYDGIVVDDADVERLRSAMRRSAMVLVPSHRSHVDYLVLSQLMVHRGMIPPHIAAGVNLSFWPLGPIFRGCGAYFLRRSFKGDALYSAVFRAYVKRLMREGFAQEFFIEGTRSRTGKSLPPRFGMLGIEIDAFLESTQSDLQFVPVAISYEKVIEEGEYERELAGGSKEREGVAGLLKATGVLRSRYGRVYVTVGEPVSLREYFAQRGVDLHQHAPEERRDTVQALGLEIVSRIDRAMLVTPTALAATALLGHSGRALPYRQLVVYAERMIDHIQAVSGGRARLSAALADLEAAMQAAVGRLLDEGLVTSESAGGEIYYRLVDGRRQRLDRYKNAILHFFAAEAIFATVLDACTVGAKPTPLSVVRQRSLDLARILEAEFIHSPDGGFAAALDAAIERAERNGYVMLGDGRVAVPTDPLARGLHRFVANLIANIIECYWVVTRTAAAHCTAPVGRRELVGLVRDALRSAYLSGEIFYEEANSKALVENAVAWLEDLGALAADARGASLSLGPGWDQERLTALVDDLSHSLPK
ncbi:MAG: 1-acyl-sn-glycerol-3-phosphate acyltransferase, partial [Deltaproteobacteria bacterium]|nr:1-acyl-sn-glycerol-3-phosphate acyltransferase [Deltaproteobacteria bacterium]